MLTGTSPNTLLFLPSIPSRRPARYDRAALIRVGDIQPPRRAGQRHGPLIHAAPPSQLLDAIILDALLARNGVFLAVLRRIP